MLGGCTSLAPDYERPTPPLPADIRPALHAGAVDTVLSAQPESPPQPHWLVQDLRLRQLLGQALADNRDIRQAILAVERTQAQYGISQADRLPSINANGNANRSRSADDLTSAGRSNSSSQYSANLGFASYEIDFWGRVRNLNAAALDEFLRSQENRRSARISLAAEVITQWLALDADAQRLLLARRTLASRQQQLQLTERSHALGASSALVLAQAQSSVESARGDVASGQTQLARGRHALGLLAGSSPVDAALLPDSLHLALAPELAPQPAQTPRPALTLTDIPPALPSSLLLQRPDVAAAEHALRAANANIGVARAALLPSISLTASLGTASNELSGLFTGGNHTWTLAPQIRLPIFDGGRNQANVRIAEIAQQSALAQYEKTLQSAFKEVADALAERATLVERLNAQLALVQATARTLELSQARFRLGADNYLTVLDAQRSLYSAEQGLINLRQSEQNNRITLYKALGGQWRQASAEAGPP